MLMYTQSRGLSTRYAIASSPEITKTASNPGVFFLVGSSVASHGILVKQLRSEDRGGFGGCDPFCMTGTLSLIPCRCPHPYNSNAHDLARVFHRTS